MTAVSPRRLHARLLAGWGMRRLAHWYLSVVALCGGLFLMLVGPLPVSGQEPMSLSVDSLMQFERVRVHLYSPPTLLLAGRVVGSEGDTLRLESDAGRMNVAHDQINRLQIKTDEGNPGGGFLLGALIGGAVGGLGTFARFSADNHGYAGFVFGTKVGLPLGALVGGMIGLASAGPTWRDVELRP